MAARGSTEQAGTAAPRRLLGLALSAAWVLVAVVVGYFLWPTSLGGCTTLTIVSGHSMEPTYYTGDLVVSRCGDVGVGDVITYRPPDVDGVRVIHRIVGGTADGWIVQGDNNDFLDPWQPTADDILGRSVLRLPQVGKVAGLILSPLTWVSLLVIALAVIVWPGRRSAADAEQEIAQDVEQEIEQEIERDLANAEPDAAWLPGDLRDPQPDDERCDDRPVSEEALT